jgi:hypothetical protein
MQEPFLVDHSVIRIENGQFGVSIEPVFVAIRLPNVGEQRLAGTLRNRKVSQLDIHLPEQIGFLLSVGVLCQVKQLWDLRRDRLVIDKRNGITQTEQLHSAYATFNLTIFRIQYS